MSFNVEQRDDETGLWVVIQHFSTPRPTGFQKLMGSYCGDFWFAYHENHINTRKEAVRTAKELHRIFDRDVRVVGNMNINNTSWNTYWKNGKWVD